jgi:hypothetical protein
VTARRAAVLAALTVAAGATVLAGPRPAAVAGGLLLAFALPGTALTAVLFRRRDLSGVERAVLAPALSLATLVVGGLVLNALGVRLAAGPWAGAAGGVTLVALALPVVLPARGAGVTEAERAAAAALGPAVLAQPALIRAALGRPVPADALPAVPAAGPALPPGRWLARQALPLAVAAAVLAGAGWLSYRTAREAYDVPVTALSAAPSGPMDAAGLRTVTVTASGLVAADGPYTLVVSGSDGAETDRRGVAAGATAWTAALVMPGRDRMTVGLYRAGDTDPYRTLFVAAAGD